MLFVPTWKATRWSMNSNGTELEQVMHTNRTSCRSGWPRGFVELNPGRPRPWIFTRLNLFQSSFILIHFCYGPNTCAREVRARCSFAMWQKSRRNHCSCVWKEAVSGTIFVPAQKPFGRTWTISLNNGTLFMVGQWSVPENTNNLSSIIINVVSEETL